MLKNIKYITFCFLVILLSCGFCFAEEANEKYAKTESKGKVVLEKRLAIENSAPSSLSQSSILAASSSVKSYINKNGVLPNYVTIENYNFSMPEFLYLSSKTIIYKNAKSSSKVDVKYNIKNPDNPIGDSINLKNYKASYVARAKSVSNFISTKNIAPNYAAMQKGKMKYQTIIYEFSAILAYTHNNKVLPNYVTVNLKNTNDLNKYLPNYNREVKEKLAVDNKGTSNSTISQTSTISQNSILSASTSVKKFIETNGKLPNYVKISNNTFSMPEYLYLISKTIIHKYTNFNGDMNIKYNIGNSKNPTGDSISATIPKTNYYEISDRIASYIDTNNNVPNYVVSKYGKIQYQTAIYGLAKVGDYINKNKVLPNYLTLNIKNTHSMNKYIPNYIR